MTIYGRSDIDFISISGVEHTHARKKNEANISITCLECEAHLVDDPMWSTNPRSIPLTPDEVMDLEDAQNEIGRFEAMRIAEDARSAAEAFRAAGTAPRPRASR